MTIIPQASSKSHKNTAIEQLPDARDLLESFLRYLNLERKYSSNTINSYRRDLQIYLDHLNTEADPFNRLEIRDFLSYRLREGNSRRTIARNLASIRSWCRFLQERNFLQTNPAQVMPVIKLEKPLPVYLDEEEIEQAIESIGTAKFTDCRDRLIIELFYSSGIRLSEMEALDLGSFRDGLVKVYGKGAKERILPLGKPALLIKDRWLVFRAAKLAVSKTQAANCLLLNNRGERLGKRSIQRIVSKRLSEVSIKRKLSPHVLRHSFATHMLNRGADLAIVQELLGHSSLSATQVYTHLTGRKLTEIYKQAFPRSGEQH